VEEIEILIPKPIRSFRGKLPEMSWLRTHRALSLFTTVAKRLKYSITA
jgi:hypothetical protein